MTIVDFYGPQLEDIEEYEELDQACILYAKIFEKIATSGYVSYPSGRNEAFKWLRQTAYCLVRASISGEYPFDELNDRIGYYGRRQRGLKGKPSPFQLGLLAMFAHEPDLLSEKYRYSLGRQLEYAHYHRVPPAFLEGFIKDIGTKRAVADAGTRKIHERYFEWVVDDLIKSGASKFELKKYNTKVRQSVAGAATIGVTA